MIIHYIEVFDALEPWKGVKIEMKVKERNFNISPPFEGAIAYRYFDQMKITILGITIKGIRTKVSSLTYWGKAYTLEEIENYFPNEKNLIWNMRSNGCRRAVKTVKGGWYLLRNKERVSSNFS